MEKEAREILIKIESKINELNELLNKLKPEIIIKQVKKSGTGKHVYISNKWDDKEVGIVRLSKKKEII